MPIIKVNKRWVAAASIRFPNKRIRKVRYLWILENRQSAAISWSSLRTSLSCLERELSMCQWTTCYYILSRTASDSLAYDSTMSSSTNHFYCCRSVSKLKEDTGLRVNGVGDDVILASGQLYFVWRRFQHLLYKSFRFILHTELWPKSSVRLCCRNHSNKLCQNTRNTLGTTCVYHVMISCQYRTSAFCRRERHWRKAQGKMGNRTRERRDETSRL